MNKSLIDETKMEVYLSLYNITFCPYGVAVARGFVFVIMKTFKLEIKKKVINI